MPTVLAKGRYWEVFETIWIPILGKKNLCSTGIIVGPNKGAGRGAGGRATRLASMPKLLIQESSPSFDDASWSSNSG